MRDGLGRVERVVVLGGSSEIGLATASALVGLGARRVTLAARRPERLEGAVRRLLDAGAETCDARPFDADAIETHEGFVEGLFDDVDVDVDVDVAILAFGVLGDQLASEKDPSAAVSVARTNYLGAVSVLTSLARRMDEQGHGTIVALSSVAGERGRRSNYVYGSSKAGLDVYCQGLGDRLRPRGVQVLIVRPGFVVSRMTRGLRRPPLSTTPPDVASAIVRAIENGAQTIWVPAGLRWVMSGLRHLPRAAFRRLPI